MAWDAESPALLHAVTAEGGYLRLRFGRAPDVSPLGTAVVVDGRRLLITPLRLACVPPPMAAASALLPAAAGCLALRGGGGAEAIATVLSDGRLALLESAEADLWEEALDAQLERTPWSGPGQPRLLPRLLRLASSGLEAAGAAPPRLAAWLGRDRLLLVAAARVRTAHLPDDERSRASGVGASSGGADVLVEVAIGDGDEATEVAVRMCPPVLALAPAAPEGPLLPAPWQPLAPAPTTALLQLCSGRLLLYSSGGALEPAPEAACFPVPCPRMAAAPPAAGLPHGPAAALGLSERGQLLCGGRQLAADATSFALRCEGPGGAYLLFTTRQHTLATLDLGALQQQQPGPLGQGLGGAAAAAAQTAQSQRQQQQQRDVRVRAVEQHALLVAVPPGGVDAVLQMPRGNLEAVRPRALVVPGVPRGCRLTQGPAASSKACTAPVFLSISMPARSHCVRTGRRGLRRRLGAGLRQPLRPQLAGRSRLACLPGSRRDVCGAGKGVARWPGKERQGAGCRAPPCRRCCWSRALSPAARIPRPCASRCPGTKTWQTCCQRWPREAPPPPAASTQQRCRPRPQW